MIRRLFFGQSRFGELPESHQDAGVDAVGLGEDAQPLGEVADPSGVDQRDGQRGVEQRVHEGTLQPAGRFDDDGGGPAGSGGGIREDLDDPRDARRIVGEGLHAVGIGSGQVEFVLGDIDADEEGACREGGSSLHRVHA